MYISNILIVVDQRNLDLNNLSEIAAAVADAGGEDVTIDESAGVIEAAVPSSSVSVVEAMEGVKYVRTIFSYFRGTPEAQPEVA